MNIKKYIWSETMSVPIGSSFLKVIREGTEHIVYILESASLEKETYSTRVVVRDGFIEPGYIYLASLERYSVQWHFFYRKDV